MNTSEYNLGLKMKEWETAISLAQSAFQHKKYNTAIMLNKKALEIANNNFEDNIHCNTHKAVASIMISHFSLADTYIAIKSYDQAYLLYQQCFDFIQITNTNLSNRTIDFGTAICCAIKKLKHEWSAFEKEYSEELQEKHLIAPYEFKNSLSCLLEPNASIH